MGELNVRPDALIHAADRYGELARRLSVIASGIADTVERIAATHGPIGSPAATGIATGLSTHQSTVAAKAADFTRHGQRLTEHAATYSAEDRAGAERHRQVQLVDHTIKLNPQEGDGGDKKPNPKDPHPTDPNRSRDGTYGPGNSGDGKAAAKAALDERERKTHIPSIRQEVRATHPDMRHENGTPQYRYYDALEPTGNPDEYIGLEAKSNPKSLRPNQVEFDDAVSPERPATATLNGRPITIVDAQTIYPPDGWVPPSQMGPGAGASAGQSSIPDSAIDSGAGFGGVHSSGTAPLSPASKPESTPFGPSWGTHLTPQELIDSGDPALRVIGEAIRAQQGGMDPSGTA